MVLIECHMAVVGMKVVDVVVEAVWPVSGCSVVEPRQAIGHQTEA